MLALPSNSPVVRLSKHAFAYQQLPGSWCQNNVGIIQLDQAGAVLLVDTVAIEARNLMLRRALETLAAVQIDVVNTHFHGDHTFGNFIFSDGNILGTELTAELIVLAGDDLVRRQPGINFGNVQVTPPTKLVSNGYSISTAWGDVQFLEFKDAHTASDLVVWLPTERVLFTGDIAWNNVTPFALMGSVTGSIEALEILQRLDAQTVVPGHGPVGGAEMLQDCLDYLRLILVYAEQGINTGANVWETAEEFERESTNVKIDNERNIANIARAFADLRGADDFDVLAELAVMEKWKNRTSLHRGLGTV
ncbi:Metallo-beta-lactamase superfamily [Propionibacterium ruminifibrarum]|uniref:Metallo-beta-lactamase superfamily n=1 Tax=Propionibacterium ruminifibrarum TaxID=1962131 RepID=A0A375I3Q5_9ACTN|nr:MBL fold metallo-hydrolase [Propionibacterium ruminifibrarum]SPF68354.1 Metallo-beta-lactamase superfamily [Propionibacterium ruminifibrarum]